MSVKKLFSKVLPIIIALLFMLSSVSVCALSEEEITSPGAVLVETTTGKILFEKNAHEQRACASITKVMTLLLVMEALDEGKITLDETITSSAHAASMGGSDIWLEEGEQMTVDDMIKATAVASANDCAVALAEHICGSEDDFVAKMNDRAKELGMKDTVFKNCNGLDEEGHITSAYDVSVMSCELIKHKKIFDYTSIWLDTLRGGETQIVNTNKLLKTYNGITGLKTGTTSQAGSCITATAERNGLSLCAVVLGADSGTARFKEASTLLDFGFANYESVSMKPDISAISPLKVENGMEESVELYCDDNVNIVVEKGKKDSVAERLEMGESIEAPIKKGDTVGKIVYSLDGKEVASISIYASCDVEKVSFSSVLSKVLCAFTKM